MSICKLNRNYKRNGILLSDRVKIANFTEQLVFRGKSKFLRRKKLFIFLQYRYTSICFKM